MYLPKTGSKPEPPAQNAASLRNAAASKAPPPQAAASAPANTAAPRSAAALIAAAGLPADKLSASIISFARFFSLPLKPELMAAIRRQALATSPTATPSTVAETQANAVKAAAENAPEAGALAKIREAFSLAAAAAESKGVELHPKGLAVFAEAIDPDWRKREDSGGDQRGRRDKDRQQQEEKNAADKTVPITAAGLKEMALESMEKNPLLAILNRMPGKNGQRWIVLPFSFDEGGREFKVSLRILLEGEQESNRAVCVALDIAETGRRWLFALESAKTTYSPIADRLSANRLSVYIQPELPQKAHAPLVRELSHLLKIPLERISVKTWAESFPGESGGEGDLPLSINEAV